MYDYKRIRELIIETSAEMRLIIKEEGPKKLKRDIDKMVKFGEQPDKTSLCKMSNFEIFIIFINLLNDDKFTYEETMEYCTEAKRAINNWTFDKDGNNLLTMQDQTNDDGSIKDYKYINVFTSLGLTPIFSDYKMRLLYTCMYEFLKLKKDILMSSDLSQKLPYKNRLLIMQSTFKNSNFSNFIEVAKQYINKQMNSYNERIERATTRLKYTKEFEKAFEKGEIDDLTEIPPKWHQYLDPRILEELYSHVEHNLIREYSKLEKKEQELEAKMNKSPLIRFIYDNNLNPYSLSEDILSSLESIPNILVYIKFFMSLNIPLNDVLTTYYDYLITITDEKINTLTALINQKIISKETLKNNPSIFNTDYQKVLTNYEILKNIIDPNNIFYSDSVLLQSPEYIKNILSILKEYKLSINNYTFLLCNFQYINIYDLLIENEIPDYLFISICKTQNPLNTLKRILIYKNIEEPYVTTNNILRKDITTETKFICDDSSLDEYLPNYIDDLGLNIIFGTSINQIGESPLVKHLDSEYKVDDIYVIGGINISRAKFLRNFESVYGNSQLLIPSLVSSSILDESQYYNLVSELKRHTKQK